MGLIRENDRRPRDWAYLAAFDSKDFSLLMEMARHIRETHDTDMIEYLNNQFENHSKIINIGNNILETKNIRKTEDLVTNVGLRQCIKIILGTNTNPRWTQMIFNETAFPYPTPTVFDTTLSYYDSSINTLSISTFGWSEPKGMKMFFGVIIPQSQQPVGSPTVLGINTDGINEMGVYNGTVGGPLADLLNHEVFGSNPLARGLVNDLSVWTKVYICSCVVEFCPVA